MDPTPPARTIGYGTLYENSELDVLCGTCKAPVGVPCLKARSGSHTTRIDKARNMRLRKTSRLHSEMENAALRCDPTGPLWTFRTQAHICGTHGAHVMSTCTDSGVLTPSGTPCAH